MKSFTQAFMLLLVMTLVCGIIYPVLVSLGGQLLFFEKSNGSLIKRGETIVASALVGQKFSSPHYFWSRPSACDYQAVPSCASNLGPTSKELASKITIRRKELAQIHDIPEGNIPEDLLTASGSGLDPHISLSAANMQALRIATARGITESDVKALIQTHEEGDKFALFGEIRVNVVMLNLSLDRLYGNP